MQLSPTLLGCLHHIGLVGHRLGDESNILGQCARPSAFYQAINVSYIDFFGSILLSCHDDQIGLTHMANVRVPPQKGEVMSLHPGG
jgi:hypothetical protein